MVPLHKQSSLGKYKYNFGAQYERQTHKNTPLNKTPTPKGEFRVSNQPNGHDFGLGEEAEVPGENPHSHE